MHTFVHQYSHVHIPRSRHADTVETPLNYDACGEFRAERGRVNRGGRARAAQGARGGGQVSLLNIITELKKCCNHPFLFESAETDFRGSDDSKAVDRLVVSAGKMVLLDKLLRRLKQTGHRRAPPGARACPGLGAAGGRWRRAAVGQRVLSLLSLPTLTSCCGG